MSGVEEWWLGGTGVALASSQVSTAFLPSSPPLRLVQQMLPKSIQLLISSFIYSSDLVNGHQSFLSIPKRKYKRSPFWKIVLTGIGKCNRLEAIFSPGASKATTGAPNVTPRREASAPPSEWPGVMSGWWGVLEGEVSYRLSKCSRLGIGTWCYYIDSKKSYEVYVKEEIMMTHNANIIKQTLLN